MHRFKPNLRNSISALFGVTIAVPANAVGEIHVEDIRDSMLACITAADNDRFPHVRRRIRHASDVQALWFLRGDLMAVLASRRGESVARERLEAISEMFENLLPQGLRSRPSPLNSNTKH